MTDKKEKILTAALFLFANDGYNGVSTSKIAKEAEVSEGLIFKHFENKKGLLDAIMIQAKERLSKLMAPVISETNPKQVLQLAIALPFSVPHEEHSFWKLQFKLKWEQEYSTREKIQPLIDKLIWAFSKLDYKEAKKEAELLHHIIDSISLGILQEGPDSQSFLKDFLIKKYNL